VSVGTPDVVQLPAVPELATLYRDALGVAVLRKAGRGSAPSVLPTARHRVRDMQVDLPALTRFQQLLGSAVRDRLPSAYLHALAFPVAMSVLARKDFPLPLLGMVHLSNEVHQQRQVTASETLDVVAWSEDLRPHHAGTQLDLVTEISVDGELVWSGLSVYLARGAWLGAVPDRGQPEQKQAFAPPAPTALWRLGPGTGRRYASVSGDWNPIHLSAASARALGMKGAIAHGMYLAARMVDHAVPAPAGRLSWRIDFASPVLLPGTVATSFTGTPGPTDTGVLVDVVGWSPARQRPHFTGWVRAE
jgi:hypothetical protein